MSFETRYAKLNNEQRQAVDTTEGPVMVIAGPGSGKTELLSLRVANILQKSDVLPNNILCLTFTDAAAKNMRQRLAGLIGVEAHKVAIHTFHSFAIHIVDHFRESFYNMQKMNPADDVVQIDVIGDILDTFSFADAFSKKNPDGEFIYLRSIIGRIGTLKKAGISPTAFTKMTEANESQYQLVEDILMPVFSARMNKKVIDLIPDLLQRLDTMPVPQHVHLHPPVRPYKDVVIQALQEAYVQATEMQSTKPLTAWKSAWMKKDADSGALRLKDHHQLERNKSLAHVYALYQEKMRALGYIDFDDMVMDVIGVLEQKEGVLAELQEQYQYVLVDEFQDTNDAQMRMINLLADNPVHEGMPNVMVVGDDDQAIYKFQGAELNNILQFKEKFPGTTLITLIKNYRSTSEIVQFAQQVITQGEERLATTMKEVEKVLEAANPHIKEGMIVAHSFDTAVHEYQYVVSEISQKIAEGTRPNDIAVIARNHRQLEEIAGQMQRAGLPISYERQRDVLKDPHIAELITTVQLIDSLATDGIAYANELMPVVLAFPFWGLERATMWQLAIDAQKQDGHRRWIDAMLSSENMQLVAIAQWLLDISAKATTHPLMQVLDDIIGPAGSEETVGFVSPFRQYYFSENTYTDDPQKYVTFLSGLNTLVEKIRSYSKQVTFPKLADMVACIAVYESHGLAITDTSAYLSGAEAITLLSAHKAKGLEFDTVFVINCQKDIWAKSQGRDLIAFPKNVQIDPSAETFDDFLRLFFVALTRAKRHLYVTSYVKKENGRDSVLLPFLATTTADTLSHKAIALSDTMSSLETHVLPSFSPIALDEKVVLAPLLDNYVMSVTHLNNFLDVTKGGPHHFFEQNLLRFPQAYQPHMSYGVAIHSTIERIYAELKNTGVLPTPDVVQEIFKEIFAEEQMDEGSFKKYEEKGVRAMAQYITAAKDRIEASHWIETDFRQQQVLIHDVRITGKIDKVVPNEESKTLEVYDFKTGKAQKNWKGSDERKRITLHEYKRQLTFYKLLVEQSRDFAQYNVHRGVLEFVTPTTSGDIVLLPYDITEEDVLRLQELIRAVHAKITSLDFPDISAYEQSLDGIIAFENDLLAES